MIYIRVTNSKSRGCTPHIHTRIKVANVDELPLGHDSIRCFDGGIECVEIEPCRSVKRCIQTHPHQYAKIPLSLSLSFSLSLSLCLSLSLSLPLFRARARSLSYCFSFSRSLSALKIERNTRLQWSAVYETTIGYVRLE